MYWQISIYSPHFNCAYVNLKPIQWNWVTRKITTKTLLLDWHILGTVTLIWVFALSLRSYAWVCCTSKIKANQDETMPKLVRLWTSLKTWICQCSMLTTLTFNISWQQRQDWCCCHISFQIKPTISTKCTRYKCLCVLLSVNIAWCERVWILLIFQTSVN